MRTTWAVVIALAFLATAAADGNATQQEPTAGGNETVMDPAAQDPGADTANETDAGTPDPGASATDSSETGTGTDSEEPDPAPAEPAGETNGTPPAGPTLPPAYPPLADLIHDPTGDPPYADPTKPADTPDPNADRTPDPGAPDEPGAAPAGPAAKVVAAGRAGKDQVLDLPLPPAGTVALAALFSAVVYAVLRRH